MTKEQDKEDEAFVRQVEKYESKILDLFTKEGFDPRMATVATSNIVCQLLGCLEISPKIIKKFIDIMQRSSLENLKKKKEFYELLEKNRV